MNAKNLITAAIVSICASTAFAAAPAQPQTDFTNTLSPSEVTAQVQVTSVGSDAQAKNAGAGEQAIQGMNFANSMEPSAVTAQSTK